MGEYYLMKYDIEGRLVLYSERSASGNVMSFIKIKDGNTLLRYDGVRRERHITKFTDRCMLAHRFEAGESWVTIVSESHEMFGQTVFPDSWFSMVFGPNGQARTFTMDLKFVAKCLSLLVKNNEESKGKFSKKSKQLLGWHLHNSSLFIENAVNDERKPIKTCQKST